MAHWRRLPELLATVIVALGATGYVVFVQGSRVDRGHLATLIVPRTGSKVLKSKPVESQYVDPGKSGFAAMKKAAVVNPTETGGYGREWSGSTTSGDVATQLVEVLPTAAQAKVVRTEAVAEYSDSSTLAAQHTTVTARFHVPTVPGAFGVSFATAKSTTTDAATGSAIVFRVGRVVSVGYVESTTGGLDPANAESLARAEHVLLEKSEPGFSMVQTTRPLALSVVYGVVTALAVGLVLVLPLGIRRRRVRRQAKREEQARHEYRARGGKAMRRRRPPAWAQRARSTGSIR
jgi:hypothetical protein